MGTKVYLFHTNRGGIISCTTNQSQIISFVINYFSRQQWKRVEDVILVENDGKKTRVETMESALTAFIEHADVQRVVLKASTGTKYYLSKTLMV